MSFLVQKFHGLHGVPDYTAAYMPGYTEIPVNLQTPEMRDTERTGEFPPGLLAPPIPLQNEILAPKWLRSPDARYAAADPLLNILDNAPTLVKARLPQLGQIGACITAMREAEQIPTQITRQGRLVVGPPVYDNPSRFSNPQIPTWSGFVYNNSL